MAVAIPPFEAFYEAHKDEVLRFLRRRAGRQAADDLFQETFLRALRAYGRLEHGEHLRAWVLTIASRLIVDAARRERPSAEPAVEPGDEDVRPAFEAETGASWRRRPGDALPRTVPVTRR